MINEINYIDFEPEVVSKSFWKGNNYETTDVVMERVNDWVRKNYNTKIINVETLLLPTMTYNKQKQTTRKINMQGGYVYMIEVVRVWYK